jgi:hypothetical protein
MNWLLPITLVLAVALVVAAIHFVFMRWMARQPELLPAPEPLADDPSIETD